MLTLSSRRRRTAALLAVAAALTVAAPVAEARPGGGGSFGSRGSRTFSAPSATPTAPGGGMTMQRSQTAPSPGMTNPGMQAPAATGRRFGGGFFAGLLGAGLLGALLGGGFFGGLGGLASMIGLLFQVGLVVLVVMMVLRFFRRRNEPAGAGAPYARSNLDGVQGPGSPKGSQGPAGGMFGGPRPAQARPVQIGPADYQAFERLLGDIQDAYSREDRVTLGNLTTPEMAGYFDEELRNNAARGVVNKISDVKLLQGDLSESWGEDRTDYATVAMRYALKDVMADRASGRVVQTEASEAVELWTFQRQPGRGWVLSAIQQTR
ncbi:TIM44-like domain-containing protein [Methylobacterium sp. NEAU K]|uniref:TIM44-like domain-containing protein n=1 Tax=Methylobacterium sp. NEAU K TaxID=3064946 RepID=UPI0027343807|nr:TIM44-like domain-containing protein [Methylobacterium sp. NEAU K]MDP4002540.1 TIM44-like domain-containing protein [Methylobacterium sp. NEAU K]